jgi:hypothetical protein
MLANGYRGSIDSTKIVDEKVYYCEGQASLKGKTYAFYCTEGQIEFAMDRDNYFMVNKGDILVVKAGSENKEITIKNCYSSGSRLIIAQIYN